MILDYDYNRDKKQVSISYIKEDGNKEILQFGTTRFKSYFYSPDGPYNTWDGCKCDVRYTKYPNKFDLKEFIFDLDEDFQRELDLKTFPKLYSFDIETKIKSKYEFTDPRDADQPILTISIVSPNLNSIVIGVKDLDEKDVKKVEDQFYEYLDNIPFYKEHCHNLNPTFKYIKFDNEEMMLKFFIEKIVAKAPILAGWNSIGYDWCYITNRIRNFYPNINIKNSSITQSLTFKKFTNMRNEDVTLPHPVHTLILDMMDVIETEDAVVLPQKESMNLDYIAHESIGANKIEYDGSLQDLYEEDYSKYVFYNLIDSILVQLIDKKFKTLDHIYMYSLYCKERIGSCFSKIALTEALILKDFREHNIKVVYEQKEGVERGRLRGAYVKLPKGGRYEYVVCNDFASLYPSTLITTNMSFDNFVGAFYNHESLNKYAMDNRYITIGPYVFENIGTSTNPETGDQIGCFLDEEKLKPYRDDPNYFVTVNGHVYKNDKQYTIPRIQQTLYEGRKFSKYLSKKLEAEVMLDVEHIEKGMNKKLHKYDKQIIDCLKGMGYDNIEEGDDLNKLNNLNEFKYNLSTEITYHSNLEQAMKLMMNSIYGGTSHPGFYWFNLNLARDITGEARNNTEMMERHLSEFWRTAWQNEPDLKKIREEMGIKIVSDDKINDIILESQDKSLVTIVYGDTDSLYISYEPLLKTIIDNDKLSIREKLDIILKINLEFLDKHNNDFLREYYSKRHAWCPDFNKFELETVNRTGVWLDKIKKRYGQILLYKDGKYFDEDDLPVKVKGLEMVKSSYPTLARKQLKKMLRFLLEYDGKYLTQELNILSKNCLEEFRNANLEDICANVRCNKYVNYVIDDVNDIKLEKKAPSNVQALARYNYFNNSKKLGSEPLYGGKIKMYCCLGGNKNGDIYFGFESNKYPKWADKFAPIDRSRMYQKYVLDPFNRILESIHYPIMRIDGSIQLSLLDF